MVWAAWCCVCLLKMMYYVFAIRRFTINLAIGTTGREIAFHINPRLTQKYIVRNCKIDNEWGSEEVTSALPFRLKSDQQFSVQVLITESDYFFSVNGQHFASFRHRVPYTKVTCLQVFGDVTQVQVDQLAILQYPDRMIAGEGGGGWSLEPIESVRESDGDWMSSWNRLYELVRSFRNVSFSTSNSKYFCVSLGNALLRSLASPEVW